MRALDRLGALGKPGALLGREVDLARALGPRLAARRLRRPAGTTMPAGTRARVYRRLWEQAARDVGAQVRELSGGLLEVTRGGRSTLLREHLVQRDDPVTLWLAGDKPASLDVLAGAGLPVPAHAVVPARDPAAADGFLDGAPCVVKPASGSGRGDGITGFVVTPGDLRRARLRALRYDTERLLVERQSVFAEYRVLVMDGEVLGTVRREPPSVTGDGAATVAELVDAENRRRAAADGAAGLWCLDLDLDALLALAAQGTGPRSVPAAGARVRVHTGTSQASEREVHVLPAGQPATAGVEAAALAAAAAIGSRYAAVELMTPDPAAPLSAAGGVVLEINTTPGITQHHLVSDPQAAEPVAARVLERLLA